MPYVMIPVPEEHVEEVMQFVLRAQARAAIEPWTEESIVEIFTDVDEAARSLLSVVAHATLTGKELTDVDAGALIELSAREVSGIRRELAELSQDGNHSSLIVATNVEETLPNGRVRRRRILKMATAVAICVRDAEEAEMASQPHPLGTDPIESDVDAEGER